MRSPAHYWVAMVCDGVGALVFLALGLSRTSGLAVAAGAVVLAGFLTWSLVEYAIHRWILHGWPAPARDSHARHHANPAALISTPVFVMAAGAFGLWMLLRLVLPSGFAAFAVFGMYAGYDYFSALHHLQHHRQPGLSRVTSLRRLERLHHVHHGRPTVNFGVTTTLWDRVFGTYQPMDARRPASSMPSRYPQARAH